LIVNIKIEYYYYFYYYVINHRLTAMPQVTISGEGVYNLPTQVICSLGGKQGGVSDEKSVSYSTIFEKVVSMNHAREIVATVNRLLVTDGKKAMTWFLYDHKHYNVL
jgi:hypothetical protein